MNGKEKLAIPVPWGRDFILEAGQRREIRNRTGVFFFLTTRNRTG
jgi:hypothetical protein